MPTDDKCCTIVPYFNVPEANMQAFRKLCQAFVEKSATEPACLYYGFTFHGNQVHCREGYRDAAGALAHLDNVGALLKEALTLAEVLRLEVHGPEEELAKLRGPLSGLKPQFFTLEYGFRK